MATTHAVLNAPRVLVIDDEPDLRTLYELTLLREGYLVETASCLQEAWQALQQGRFNVVITDMRLPDGMGTEILSGLKAQQRSERCIVITAYGSAENAVESLKAGAFDYLTKPVDLKQFRQVIASALQEAEARDSLPRNTIAHKTPFNTRAIVNGEAALSRLVGESSAMRTVRERIARVARSMAPVLIHGESGTGKELAARALHANSHRAGKAWVAVNCSAIPENLLEAEFFGAKKGAFTGAHADREGFFRAAHGGTLFLDEIGDLPLAMQSKLLRAIQERCIRAVGSDQEEPVDVRIVSATHKDLQIETAAGRFRQDLYYRLNVIDVSIPPLRERLEDLPGLCESLLARIAQETGASVPHMAPQALQQLARLPLLGNVRELENLLHRAMALCDGNELVMDEARKSSPGEIALLPLAGRTEKSETESAEALPADLQGHLDQQEREILIRTLNETHFNRTLAANRLGITLRQIRYRIARLKIDTPSDNETPDA